MLITFNSLFNSFDRTSSLVLRYSIVLSLYKCNTTRMVGWNRTTTAQDTLLQIKNKHNTIQKQTHTHIRISLKPLIYQDILYLIKLLQLNTTAILDLHSYTYVTCISLKNRPPSLSLLKTGFNALESICIYE